MARSLSWNHLINLDTLWRCLCPNQMTNWLTWHGLCASFSDALTKQRLIECKGDHWKPRDAVCFGNGYLCLGCMGDAELSNNHHVFFLSLFLSATVTMCLCVAPTERATRMNATWGRLPASSRVRSLWSQKDPVPQVRMSVPETQMGCESNGFLFPLSSENQPYYILTRDSINSLVKNKKTESLTFKKKILSIGKKKKRCLVWQLLPLSTYVA